jgi:translation initiation factor eIF-2B subunit alpha
MILSVQQLESWIAQHPESATATGIITVLTSVVSTSQGMHLFECFVVVSDIRCSVASTILGLLIELRAAADALRSYKKSSISVSASCELYIRTVTRISDTALNFQALKDRVIESGENFAKQSKKYSNYIANLCLRFIRDDNVILVHGFSRVVLNALSNAVKEGRHFSVIVTESRPDNSGYSMARELLALNIPVQLILDSAVAHFMERVSFVMVGAEGVVEDGGIINKIGTFQVAMVARALRRPFYVAAESYKFARLYPLGQRDLPETKEMQLPLKPLDTAPPNLVSENPSADYTPPDYITLLFTDLGILTPSAVSDQLINLYI